MSAATSSRSRDLMEAAIDMARERMRKDVRAKAELAAEDRVLDALLGSGASEETRLRFRHKLRAGELNEREIEVEVADSGSPMQFEVPGQPGASVGMINIGDMLGKAFGGRTKKRKMSVGESYETLMREESDKLLDQEKVVREARDWSSRTASCSSTRSTRSPRAANSAAAATSAAKACSATCCR